MEKAKNLRAGATAGQTYKEQLDRAKAEVRIITEQLEAVSIELAAPSGHDWGYAGDMHHVADELENIRRFMAGDVK